MSFLLKNLLNVANNGVNSYSNVSEHFGATPVVGTKTITLSGVPFSVDAKNVIAGLVQRIDVNGNVEVLDLSGTSVLNSVITLNNIENFITGDSVIVVLIGPDKPLDIALTNATIVDTLPIAATAATATITVTDYATLGLSTVTIGEDVLTEGTDWTAETSNDVTATNLAAAIHALTDVNATADANVVTISAAVVGAGGEEITVSTSETIKLAKSSGLLNGANYLYNGFLTKAPIMGNHGYIAGMGSGSITFTQDIFVNEKEDNQLVQSQGDYFIDYRTGFYKVFVPDGKTVNPTATYTIKKLYMS